MAYDPEKHDRRSIRLRGYDYASPGGYFVTICTLDKVCLFGEVSEGRMYLNARGRIALRMWNATPVHFPHVTLDAFVAMPNHVHGIIAIVEDNRRDAACRVPTTDGIRAFGKPQAGSLSTIVRSYKSAVTRHINRAQGTPGATAWQSRFYEHVLRGRRDLERIRHYIARNPARWYHDRYHRS